MRVNDEIRAREVRLIGENGEQIGIVPLREALRMAQEANLDLVEVASTARPVVCRLMDFGRFKYEQSKRDREARKKQKTIDIKEVQIRPTIDDHDLEVKTRAVSRFLQEGDKVKLVITFRGRQIVHADLGYQLLKEISGSMSELAVIEKPAHLEGRNMIMILSPRPQAREQSRERTGAPARRETTTHEDENPQGSGQADEDDRQGESGPDNGLPQA